MAKTLTLIDGSGYIFRAFYALPPLTRKDGTPVGAVYGFCTMLKKMLADGNHACDYMVVVFDAARKNFRNEIYSEYKANRAETPPDLIPQFPLIREAVHAFNIAHIELEGYEADDLIATLAKRGVESGFEVKVVSADKYLMQLMSDQVSVFDPLKNRLLSTQDSLDKFGVTPDKILEIQALIGDSVDNIPGVKGVGPKTAAKLISEFGSTENLMAHAKQIEQAKLRENILASFNEIVVSKKLARLCDSSPITVNFEDFKVCEPTEKLNEFFMAQGFAKLAKSGGTIEDIKSPEPFKAPHAPQAMQPHFAKLSTPTYKLISTESELHNLLQTLTPSKLVAVEFMENNLGVALCADEHLAYYIPFQTTQVAQDLFASQTSSAGIPAATVVQKLGAILNSSATQKITSDSKKTRHILQDIGGDNSVYLQDLMLASYSLYGTSCKHDLTSLAKLEFNYDSIDLKALLKAAKKSLTELNPAELMPFAAEQAFLIFNLWQKIYAELNTSELKKIYEQMELPLAKILFTMEHTGIKIDTEKLKYLNQKFEAELATLQTEIWKLAGEEFNINSSQQLGVILFDKLNLDGATRSKVSGNYVTDVDVLETLAENGAEIAQKLLRYRELSKLNSTYAVGLTKACDKNSRIHTTFMQAVTSTGRLSSTEPNLQNIPVRSEEGKIFREVFIASDKSKKIISADYSQIELRLMAHVANVKRLRADFEAGKDIHAITASRVFNIPLEQIDKDMRRRAKAINFGIIYGISAFGLAANLGIERAQAKSYIDAYFAAYPEILKYMEYTKEFARKHGFVLTPFGRKCFIDGYNIPKLRAFADRAAINAPIQGGAADIMKMAMIKVSDEIAKGNLKATLMLQIHDELVLEASADIARAEATKVAQAMQSVVNLSVPFIAEAGVGDDWGSAH